MAPSTDYLTNLFNLMALYLHGNRIESQKKKTLRSYSLFFLNIYLLYNFLLVCDISFFIICIIIIIIVVVKNSKKQV